MGTQIAGGAVVPAVPDGTYTPVLTASPTPPTLGSGSVQTGLYWYDPLTGYVDAIVRIVFGTSGVAAGSGNYVVDLPTAVGISPGGIGGHVLGHGFVNDASTAGNSRQVVAVLQSQTGGSGSVGQVLMRVLDGTTGTVTASAPFGWAASDSVVLTLRYRKG